MFDVQRETQQSRSTNHWSNEMEVRSCSARLSSKSNMTGCGSMRSLCAHYVPISYSTTPCETHHHPNLACCVRLTTPIIARAVAPISSSMMLSQAHSAACKPVTATTHNRGLRLVAQPRSSSAWTPRCAVVLQAQEDRSSVSHTLTIPTSCYSIHPTCSRQSAYLQGPASSMPISWTCLCRAAAARVSSSQAPHLQRTQFGFAVRRSGSCRQLARRTCHGRCT
jgi:hypothetical protein